MELSLMFRELRNIERSIRRFFGWLKKSFEYAWFLRDDHDWDYNYIFRLLRFKLQRTRECLNYGPKMSCTSYMPKRLRRIRVCELLLDRIISDDYCSMEWDKLREKESFFQHPHSEEYNKEVRRLGKHSMMLKDQDISYLFTLMGKHIESWWD